MDGFFSRLQNLVNAQSVAEIFCDRGDFLRASRFTAAHYHCSSFRACYRAVWLKTAIGISVYYPGGCSPTNGRTCVMAYAGDICKAEIPTAAGRCARKAIQHCGRLLTADICVREKAAVGAAGDDTSVVCPCDCTLVPGG